MELTWLVYHTLPRKALTVANNRIITSASSNH